MCGCARGDAPCTWLRAKALHWRAVERTRRALFQLSPQPQPSSLDWYVSGGTVSWAAFNVLASAFAARASERALAAAASATTASSSICEQRPMVTGSTGLIWLEFQ